MNDAAQILAIMIPISAIVGLFVMVVYLRRFENTERMSMIEKGVDPTLFTNKRRNTAGSLRAGTLLMGGGIGLLIGYFLDRAFYMEEVGYFSMLFIFGGAGLLISYLMEEKKNNKEQ